MLQLHVLVHAAFGAVGLVAAFDGAFVVSLDLSRRPAVPLALIVAMVAAELVVLRVVVEHQR